MPVEIFSRPNLHERSVLDIRIDWEYTLLRIRNTIDGAITLIMGACWNSLSEVVLTSIHNL